MLFFLLAFIGSCTQACVQSCTHTHTHTRQLAWRIANRHHILPCANDYPTTFLSVLHLVPYQVEHYLSLGNLATDIFLRSQMAACASGFMGVPLSLLASFPRIRSLCPVGEGTAKSRDDVIADILLDSKDVLVENQQVHCVCIYEYMQSCHTHTTHEHTHIAYIQHCIFLTPCTLLAVSTATFM